MGLLDRVEKGLERTVSRVFAKAFRSEVQPVEIASAIRNAMDDRASVLGPGRTMVPNLYTIELSTTDFGRLDEYRDSITEDLVAAAAEHAETQRYLPGGPIEVLLTEGSDLDTGVFRVRPETSRRASASGMPPAPVPAPPPHPAARVHPPIPGPGAVPTGAPPSTAQPAGPAAPSAAPAAPAAPAAQAPAAQAPAADAPDAFAANTPGAEHPGALPAGAEHPGAHPAEQSGAHPGADPLGSAVGDWAQDLGGAAYDVSAPVRPAEPGVEVIPDHALAPGRPAGAPPLAPPAAAAPAAAAGPAAPPAPPARPAPPMKLPRVNPAQRPWLDVDGERYPLLGSLTVIGRDATADIILDDPGISRRHSEIRITHDGPHLASSIRDLASTNGTFVNGERLAIASTRLVDGDQITIGRTAITFRAGKR